MATNTSKTVLALRYASRRSQQQQTLARVVKSIHTNLISQKNNRNASTLAIPRAIAATSSTIYEKKKFHNHGNTSSAQAIESAAFAAILAAAILPQIQKNDDTSSCDVAQAPAISTHLTEAAAAAGLKRLNRSNTAKKAKGQPRNVMLHRMRSVRARHLGEKYKVDWDTCLGEGAYGNVFPARLAATGEKVALKKISKKYTNSSAFLTETNALLRIYDNGGHPNISGLRDMYEDDDHYYLVMDLVSGGEMFDHLINYGAYSEADASRLVLEVASALAFLHGVGVVHADLKPENLLLCSKKKSDGTIKLIDFGCAVVYQDNYHDDDDEDACYEDDEMRPKANTFGGKKIDMRKSMSSTGTTAYWPPERFKGAPVDQASDMWSLGVILFIMLVGIHPFDLNGMSTDKEIARRIARNPKPPFGKLTEHLSPSAVDLIQKLMERDPAKRLTAREMLRHPWIRGETASTSIMTDSDKKLSKFKELRYKLEAGIFAVLVSHAHKDATLSEAKLPKQESHKGGMDIMKKAFASFDEEGKGFVSSDDLGRVVGKMTGSALSSIESQNMLEATLAELDADPEERDELGLSLSDFSQLFSRLKHVHFPRGHVIFNAGDEGDAMYFLNSGKVEIKTRKGQLIAILRQGDFFGEGSLLDEENRRFTSAVCASPVDVMKISREDFSRYIESTESTKAELKVKWKARSLSYAKNLIRLQTNVKLRVLKKAQVVYNEGDNGESMFLVDENDGGILDVTHDGVKVHSYHGGDSFGESSLLFSRPRSSTVTCVSDTCRIHEMHGSHFLDLVKSSPEVGTSLLDMCRKRYFKKAVKKINREKQRTFDEDDLVAAFHDVDVNKDGKLHLEDIRHIMHMMDPNLPESEILALFKFLDVDDKGSVSIVEFKRMFRVFENMEH